MPNRHVGRPGALPVRDFDRGTAARNVPRRLGAGETMTHRNIKWTPQWYYGGKVVWIDVNKLDQAWKRNSLYIGSVRTKQYFNNKPKYYRFGSWISNYRGHVRMPHVHLCGNGVSFADGRHRFAWMRDHGITTLPVTTEPSSALQLARACGTRSRACILKRIVLAKKNP